MAIVGDVFMFTVRGTINSQRWENVHFYLLDGLTAPLSEGQMTSVVEEFIDWYVMNVYSPISTSVPSTMSWDTIRGENLFNVSELAEIAFAPGTDGSSTGVPLAQYNSFAFFHPTGRRGMNPGQRRLPGVTETTVEAYGEVTSGMFTALTGLAAAFSATIVLEVVGGNSELTLKPIILKRVRSGTGTPADPYQYRLPMNTSERTYYVANNWSVKTHITTQNSRKTGRGI